jgi:hypothetical protein
MLTKHENEIFKHNRRLTDTGDKMKSFMMRHNCFVDETNGKFSDFENAISQIEQSINYSNVDEKSVSDNDDKSVSDENLTCLNIFTNKNVTNNINDIDEVNNIEIVSNDPTFLKHLVEKDLKV